MMSIDIFDITGCFFFNVPIMQKRWIHFVRLLDVANQTKDHSQVSNHYDVRQLVLIVGLFVQVVVEGHGCLR